MLFKLTHGILGAILCFDSFFLIPASFLLQKDDICRLEEWISIFVSNYTDFFLRFIKLCKRSEVLLQFCFQNEYDLRWHNLVETTNFCIKFKQKRISARKLEN